ncbi:MAG: hypothetical protein EOM67_02455 [Spirochaetia bacterium]|nr:hypothetical protein [Spirochaetia bacterium]
MKKKVMYLQVFARLVSPLITLLVTILSLLPSSDLAKPLSLFPFSDKIMHLIAYVGVSGTISIALAKIEGIWTLKEYLYSNMRRIIVTFFVVFTIGFLIEIVQPLFSRSREFLDLLFNSIGGVLGIILGLLLLFILQRRSLN